MSSKCVREEVSFGSRNREFCPAALFCLFTFLAAVLLLSGCKGGGSSTATVTSVSITPAAATVAPGTQSEFTATVNLTNTTTSTSTAVTWEVNGTAGGNSTLGTIVPSSTDNQVGVYSAPTVVPSTNNGQVSITAVAQQTNTTSSSSTTTVTSNTATVTIAVATGFSISPNNVSTVPAGGTQQFTAILNGVTDGHATWSVSSSTGGNPGAIGANSGLYIAPLFPPAGNSITITGQDGSSTASETIKLVYSDHSIAGPYSFAYTGDNQLGFYSVVGSFVADGNGNIESGVEDVDSFQTGVTPQVAFTGNYVVGSDGRGTVNLSNGNTWRFVLGTNQHALIVRSDVGNTGGGTMDQQNVNALTNSNTVISGAYAFTGSGADAGFNPLAMGGKFTANGAGTIPAGNNILDLNDGGTVTKSDTSLNGSYLFDPAFPDTGRGVLTLTSTATGQRQYAFYTVDSTHLRLLEIDHNAYFAGDAFSAPSGTSFSVANLAAASYVFTAGGNSGAGAYAAAGLFTSDGAGDMTGGAFDANNAGTIQSNVALTSCTYSVDSSTGRVDLKLCGAGTSEFAVYPTAENSAAMVELDATAVSSGIGYQQQAPSTSAPGGNLALALFGQGIFHNAPGSYQQDVDAQIVAATGTISSGNIDINSFSAVFSGDLINTTSATSGTTTTPESSFGSPSNGRGTAMITGTSPPVSYKLVYYFVNGSTALLLDQDSGFILEGVLTTQF